MLRRVLGDTLRRHRQRQARSLRDVASVAGVSLGYLSEIERGRKEASSELLSAVCAALRVPLSEVLREASERLAVVEAVAARPTLVRTPAGPGPSAVAAA